MIRMLKGEIEFFEIDSVILNVNGIGFQIFMPLPYIEYLKNETGTVKIFTYMVVREDAMQLYGFLNKEDLKLFELLITVSGIGPKGAISILSIMPGDELKYAIYIGDSKAIAMANGIGKKTAEKCIVELKDKVSIDDDYSASADAPNSTSNIDNETANDAIEALTSLGYSLKDAKTAVSQIEIEDYYTSEDILKLALKYLV